MNSKTESRLFKHIIKTHRYREQPARGFSEAPERNKNLAFFFACMNVFVFMARDQDIDRNRRVRLSVRIVRQVVSLQY